MKDPFYLFGILPLPWDLAPLFVTLITPSFLNSKTVIILNVISLLCGYFLSFGLLAILPDVYWSACFLFNVTIFLLVKSSHFQAFIESLSNDNRGVPSNVAQDVVEEAQRVNGLDEGDIEMGRGEIGSERNRERERRSGDMSGSSSPNSRPRNQWDSEGGGTSAWSPLLGQRGGRGESKGREGEEEEEEEAEEGLFESRRYPDDASSSTAWGGRR